MRQRKDKTVQYALMPVPDGRHILVDAAEYLVLSGLDANCEPVLDEPVDEAKFTWRVVYGSLMPSPLHLDCDVVGTMMGLCGCAFGRLVSVREPAPTCRVSEIRDIKIFEATARGRTVSYPVAALIGTVEAIPKAHKQALTMFPRYRGMDVLTNVINRPFLMALKGEEQRGTKAINAVPDGADWAQFVNEARAKSTALKCR
jgi:hypothetical protein